MNEKRKQVGVAWKKTTQDGKTFVSIVINNGLSPDIRLTMWSNSFKEKEMQPDYMLYLSEDRPKRAAAPADDFPSDTLPSDSDMPF